MSWWGGVAVELFPKGGLSNSSTLISGRTPALDVMPSHVIQRDLARPLLAKHAEASLSNLSSAAKCAKPWLQSANSQDFKVGKATGTGRVPGSS